MDLGYIYEEKKQKSCSLGIYSPAVTNNLNKEGTYRILKGDRCYKKSSKAMRGGQDESVCREICWDDAH